MLCSWCAVPGIDEAVLENAGGAALENITRFCKA